MESQELPPKDYAGFDEQPPPVSKTPSQENAIQNRTMAKIKAGHLDPKSVKLLFKVKKNLEKAEREGDHAATAKLYCKLGSLLCMQGLFDRCLSCYSKAIKLYRQLGQRTEEANTYEAIAFVHHQLGDACKTTGLGRDQRAVRDENFNQALHFKSDIIKVPPPTSEHLQSIEPQSTTRLENDFHAQVMMSVHFAQRQQAKESDDRRKEIGALCRLATMYNKVQELTKAIELLKEAVEMAEGLPEKAAILHDLAAVYRANGKETEAINALKDQLALATKDENQYGVYRACMSLGAAYVVMSDYAEGSRYYKLALSSAESLGDRAAIIQAGAYLDQSKRNETTSSVDVGPQVVMRRHNKSRSNSLTSKWRGSIGATLSKRFSMRSPDKDATTSSSRTSMFGRNRSSTSPTDIHIRPPELFADDGSRYDAVTPPPPGDEWSEWSEEVIQIERLDDSPSRQSLGQRRNLPELASLSIVENHNNGSRLTKSPDLIMPAPPSPFQAPLSPKPEETYVAIYDYAAKNQDELTLREGDLVINLTKLNDGWYFGTNSMLGAEGMFPSNYVEISHLELSDNVCV